MALSRPCCPSTDDGIPAASTSASVTKEEVILSGNGHKEELIRLRADMVCVGCRCGWLCCDCFLGCLSCKQRRRFCYCRWHFTSATGRFVRIYCEICVDLCRSCQCQTTYRCKWCTVSLEKCTRGGCVSLLPDRFSPEAEPFVNIFNREDKSDEDEEDAAGSLDDEADKRSLASCSSNSASTSLLTWCPGSPDTSLSRSRSVTSLAPDMQDEWWNNQQRPGSNPLNGVNEGLGRSDDDMFASTNTVSSVSSGGSYSSLGGKTDV